MPLLSQQASGKTGQAICNGVYKCVIRRWAILASGLLFSVMLVLHIASLRHKELTTDEPLHYKYGYRVLHGTPRRTAETDSSTMPFSSLHAMTSDNIAIVATSLGFSVDKSWAGQIKRGRYATIALSLLLALYVLRWSYALYGYKGGLLSLSLYVLDPNFLAHGQLVTADVAAALMTTVALYYFWQFLKLGGKGQAFLSAMTLGLSQLAKYSCVYLYPIFLLLAPIYCSLNRTTAPAVSTSPQTMVNSVRHWSFVIALFIAVNIIIINVGFKFDGAGTPLSKYTFKDGLFKTLQGTPIIASLPLPLPIPYLQGLDLCKFEEKMGKAWGNIYMAGRLRVNYHNGTLHGFPGYYFYAAFFKVPIATQIIFLAALVAYFWPRNHAAAVLRREEVFLVVPMLVYWVYFNFFFNAQIGIRHVLPAFALGIIFCGRFLVEPGSKLRNYAALLLVLWVGASTLSYYPHFISYFNEFVLNRKLAYQHLADSNLDWHGDEWYLAEYLRRHPGTISDPRKPQAGRIVVPVNALVGVNRNPEQYRWLREHFAPVDQVAYSFLVYDVPEQMLLPADIKTKDSEKLLHDSRQH